MYYSDDTVEEVREKNDIVDVIGSYINLQKKGSSYFGLCPFHNEKSPSFSVSKSKQMYYCFGCGEGGNVITFLMKYENCTFQEALSRLADRAGISLPDNQKSGMNAKNRDIKSNIIKINTDAAVYYHNMLRSKKGERAYNYLKKRKLSDKTIVHFGLGYSDKYGDGLYRHLKEKGYKDEELKETELVVFNEKRGTSDRFWNRVMFPIMDANGRVVAFGGRVMGDGSPKYLNSPETKAFEKSRSLYGLFDAKRSHENYFLICEGYMDVITLYQAGFDNAVAALGTAFTSRHAAIIKRYVSEVVLTFDNDEAGKKAAKRAIPYLVDAGISVKVIDMSPYNDPDDFIEGLGADEYKNRIKTAKNYFIFLVAEEIKKYDIKNPHEKTALYEKISDMLLRFSEEVERDNYLEAVCEEFSLPKDKISSLVRKKALSYIGKDVSLEIKSENDNNLKKDDAVLKAERILLAYMAQKPQIFEQVKDILSPIDFSDEFYRDVAEALWNQISNRKEADPARIMDGFSSEEEHTKIAKLFVPPFSKDLNEADKEKAINDAVLRIKRQSLEKKLEETSDMEMAQKILQELNEIKKTHINL